MLKSCGGNCLNIVAQIDVTLSREEQQIDTPVLIQKDAPHILLLGTDLLLLLGFVLSMTPQEK